MHKVLWIFLALLVSALSLLVARQFLVYLPADHFCQTRDRTVSRSRHVLQRLAGVLLILLGAVLAIPGVPGQGLLLVLIGLMLLDIPVLRRVELRILRVPVVLRAVNRLREHAQQPPLELPQASDI